MTECILHIGFPKTGTSSIQSACFEHRQLLEEHRGTTIYSEYEKGLHILSEETDVEKHVLPRFFNRASKFFDDQLTNPKIRAFVLSDERFSNFTANSVSTLGSFLKRYFSNITVVVYVRHPFSFANSVAQQLLKQGFTYHYLSTNPRSVAPLYRFSLEPYLNEFGRKNVIVRNFAKEVLIENDVVTDFFETILKIPKNKIPTKEIRTNKSLGLETANVLEAVNRLFPINPKKDSNREKKRSDRIVPYLKTLEVVQSFQMPNFDWQGFKKLVSNDVNWLRKLTGGEIDYSLEQLPSSTKYTTNQEVDAIASIINELLLENEEQRNRGKVFRTLWRMRSGKETDTSVIKNVLKNCEDGALFLVAAKELRQSDNHDLSIEIAKMGLRKTGHNSQSNVSIALQNLTKL